MVAWFKQLIKPSKRVAITGRHKCIDGSWWECSAKERANGAGWVCYPHASWLPVFLHKDGTADGEEYTRWQPVSGFDADELEHYKETS
jgi:hypothetical protein